MNKGSFDKWEEYSQKYKIDNTKLATFNLTLKNTLKLLDGANQGNLLDIGCGFGFIDVLLAKNTNFSITATDLSDTAIVKAKELVEENNLADRIKIEKQDVYNLDYPDDSFDVITSFGYASAASYKGVIKEVKRVLKPGGILILDYINHASLYNLLLIKQQIRNYREFKKGNLYNFADKGVIGYYKNNNMIYKNKIFFNTYPPIFKNTVPEKFYYGFEKTIGRAVPRFLGRVILFRFDKPQN